MHTQPLQVAGERSALMRAAGPWLAAVWDSIDLTILRLTDFMQQYRITCCAGSILAPCKRVHPSEREFTPSDVG